MKATKIMWDIDYDKDMNYLPTEVEIPTEIAEDPNYAKPEYKDALIEHISDWLSDEYGFCHEGFVLEM